MATLRRFSPFDLLRFNNVNLDPLTETFTMGFYLQYLAKWPQYCFNVDAPHGRSMGYVLGKAEGSGAPGKLDADRGSLNVLAHQVSSTKINVTWTGFVFRSRSAPYPCAALMERSAMRLSEKWVHVAPNAACHLPFIRVTMGNDTLAADTKVRETRDGELHLADATSDHLSARR